MFKYHYKLYIFYANVRVMHVGIIASNNHYLCMHGKKIFVSAQTAQDVVTCRQSSVVCVDKVKDT